MSTTLTPNLMSEDLNASVVFYRDILGFRFLAGMPFGGERPVDVFQDDVPLQWAMLELDGARVMFQVRTSMAREYPPLGDVELGASATLYLEVEGLDSLLQRLDASVEFLLPDHVTFYGMREAWIRDNNGYLLVLAEKANPC